VNSKNLVHFVKVLIIFWGIMWIIDGIFRCFGAANLSSTINLIWGFLWLFRCVIGVCLIWFHNPLACFLFQLAGKPQWSRRHIHPLILVMIGTMMVITCLENVVFAEWFVISLIFIKGVSVNSRFVEFFLMGGVICLFFIPSVLLILGAKWISQQMDRLVLSK